nr:MAG TPA: RNA polymerase subunit [Caudoviricetes sp.]DAN85592.1 MAG TPA: RNA polymerase subunit [Caudoviricetes sp.]
METCVCCGARLPCEGRLICWQCEHQYDFGGFYHDKV